MNIKIWTQLMRDDVVDGDALGAGGGDRRGRLWGFNVVVE